MLKSKQTNINDPLSQQIDSQPRSTGLLHTQPGKVTLQAPDTATISQSAISNQQLTLITQLMQITLTMHHINELFLWLARSMVQRLGVQVVQFWTNQEAGLNPYGLELQRMASQNSLIPQHIVVNDQTTQVIRLIAAQHYTTMRQSVSSLFPHTQVAVLKHYGLNYCTAYCQHSSTWQATSGQRSRPGQLPTPFMVVALLFFQQPPSQRLHVSIEHILEQGLLAARNRGLIQSPPIQQEFRLLTAPLAVATSSTQHSTIQTLTESIPRRIDDIHLMRSINPLASSVDIADRQARRLYVAIDGHKNLTELSLTTRLTMRELSRALHLLITQQRVRLYGPGGKPLDDLRHLDTL